MKYRIYKRRKMDLGCFQFAVGSLSIQWVVSVYSGQFSVCSGQSQFKVGSFQFTVGCFQFTVGSLSLQWVVSVNSGQSQLAVGSFQFTVGSLFSGLR